MSRQAKPQPHQKLWLCRYGTMTRLVWASNAQWAERKIRTGVVDTLATPWQIELAEADRERNGGLLRGEILIREATAADIEEWTEAGGAPVEWNA